MTKQEIKDTIEAYLLKDRYGAYEIPAIRQRPVLLIGPPGVGKTQIMEQISQEMPDWAGGLHHHPSHQTECRGTAVYRGKDLQRPSEYTVTEYTMSEIVASIYDKIESTGLREGILFIDEINCVSETLAPTMLQFLQCKTFGTHAIPEGWIIVAAGNPPEYNKSVREFDVVTLDRIKMIHVEPDYRGVEGVRGTGTDPSGHPFLSGHQTGQFLPGSRRRWTANGSPLREAGRICPVSWRSMRN